MSLNNRFSDSNTPSHALTLLHPTNLLKMDIQDLKRELKESIEFYELEGLEGEVDLWHLHWKMFKTDGRNLEEMDLIDVIPEAETFFPIITKALNIALAQPCTTCTIERSFSTLRRVKTWLRSGMGEERLICLCMISAHRQMINGNLPKFVNLALERFAEDKRRLVLK